MEYRMEHDTMGEVRVPKDALYRAQTQRAVENFPISGSGLEPEQIIALARIKKAAAIANAKLGILDAQISSSIQKAADQIIAGNHLDHFPVDVFQTGRGTSSNMNMNEVLATLATAKLGSKVHPNDHVNASQSSNDVFPTSVHLAVTSALIHNLLPALDHQDDGVVFESLGFVDRLHDDLWFGRFQSEAFVRGGVGGLIFVLS